MKPAKTILEFIGLLKSRNLIFTDEHKAERFLFQNNYEEFIKEMTAELASKGELDIKSATKVSDNGKFAKVIVYAGKKGDEMAVPTAVELVKDGGNWKVRDTPKQ